MRKIPLRVAIISLSFMTFLPSVAFAAGASASASTQFSKEGIFGCSQNAATLSNSVGAFSATGGVYVPVADYTTELNTGTMVYQQCVLRGLVNRMSDSAITTLNKKIITSEETGNDGSPLRSVNRNMEEGLLTDRIVARDLKNGTLSKADPSIAPAVRHAYAVSYQQETRNPSNVLVCPMRGTNARDFIQSNGTNVSNGDFWNNILALSYDACNPLGAEQQFSNLESARIAAERQAVRDELIYGRGFYGVSHIDENGNRMVDTPSSIVQETTNLAINSGYIKTLNANDVDQMVGSLFAAFSAQVLSGSGGLAGITDPTGSQPSYLNQMTAESSAGLQNAIIGAAVSAVNKAITTEIAYNKALNATAQKLTNAILALRAAQNQCWESIIQKVCKTPLSADNTCTGPDICTTTTTTGTGGPFPTSGTTSTCTPGATLHISTSTPQFDFASKVIDPQIKPLAAAALQKIQSSQNGITLLNGLAAGAANTTSLAGSRLATIQIDQLVAQHKVHTAADVTNATQDTIAVTESMKTLLQNTLEGWQTSTDINVGWCNINNPAMISTWATRWTTAGTP